jgi:hypothetical protein
LRAPKSAASSAGFENEPSAPADQPHGLRLCAVSDHGSALSEKYAAKAALTGIN